MNFGMKGSIQFLRLLKIDEIFIFCYEEKKAIFIHLTIENT